MQHVHEVRLDCDEDVVLLKVVTDHTPRVGEDQRFQVSPCAYVVGLLDDVVIRELDLRRRGYECWVADPNLWVPFEDGTELVV